MNTTVTSLEVILERERDIYKGCAYLGCFTTIHAHIKFAGISSEDDWRCQHFPGMENGAHPLSYQAPIWIAQSLDLVLLTCVE